MMHGKITAELKKLVPEHKKLEALIAQRVFEKKVYLVNLGNENYPRLTYSYDKNPYPYDDQGEMKWSEDDFVPQYTRKISASFQVVLKMIEKGWYFSTNSISDGCFEVSFIMYDENNNVLEHAKSQDHLSNAICTAALHALGEIE